jgi:hypothetical protein
MKPSQLARAIAAITLSMVVICPTHALADDKSSNKSSGSGSNFSASDASYAEIAAIAYSELRDSAAAINKKIRSTGGAEKSKIILYSDPVFSQLTPLDIANAKIASMGASLCGLASNSAAVPQPAPVEEFASVLSGEAGSILSGIAAIAQLFTPQSASVSSALNPDDDALKADFAEIVLTSKSEIVFPDIFLPHLLSEQPPFFPKGADLCADFKWDPSTVDFYTLWTQLVAVASKLRNNPTPSPALKQALNDYAELEKNLMTATDKSPAPYGQLLKAARLKALLTGSPVPVVLLVAVDSMGGTTWSKGKTAFTEHTSFSGGVVVRYMAFQGEKLISAGTVTRTVSDRKPKEEEIKSMFNHP